MKRATDNNMYDRGQFWIHSGERVGLQGWGIEGDVRENLARSMAAWRRFSGRLAAEEKLGQDWPERRRRWKPGRSYRY